MKEKERGLAEGPWLPAREGFADEIAIGADRRKEERVLLAGNRWDREVARLADCLKAHGYNVIQAYDSETCYNAIDGETLEALIAELHTPGIDGMMVLKIARKRNPEICSIMIADKADIELATEAMRQGAYDFQVKPLIMDKVIAVLERGLSHQRLVNNYSAIHKRLDARYGFENIIGNSPQMIAVYNKITQIAPTSSTVLLCGETGTGKERVAMAIHQNSPRRNDVFVKLNCAALSEGVIESELFGHEKGAFTGAVKTHKGRFEIADGGTIFLDEVSELSSATQAKLLRVVEEREFERVGGSSTIKTDVRVIAATNKSLEEEVGKRAFRKDLYYRLNVVKIELPPLRQRKEDIALLVSAFIDEFNKKNGKNMLGITPAALNRLTMYNWPGNVRELRNCIEGMVIMSPDARRLDLLDIPTYVLGKSAGNDQLEIKVGTRIEEMEKLMIMKTLEAVRYDKREAASMLGIGLRTLYRKVKQYRLS